MPALTCSEMRAEVKKPSAKTTRMKLGNACSGLKIDGMTWYQRKIWTSSGMLRNSSVQALPSRTNHLFGVVRRMPISEPTTSATMRASTATDSVQPQADSIQSRYVMSPPLPKQLGTALPSMVSLQNTCQSQVAKRTSSGTRLTHPSRRRSGRGDLGCAYFFA